MIQDAISCPVSGRVVTRTLEVYGSKGPVQPSDEDVLIALIQFTHEYLAGSAGATLIVTDDEIERSGGDPKQVMMRLRKIHFKRADLLRRLGIKHLSGKNQQLIEQRMHRLSGVDLSVKNAYFQSDGTLVTSVGLRLIDSYAFFEATGTRGSPGLRRWRSSSRTGNFEPLTRTSTSRSTTSSGAASSVTSTSSGGQASRCIRSPRS
ncbi:MAG: hypothetical protein IPF82_15690 [Blastocatellia bacterium]|nr:hypothetical protein [Blastocatellia bacterium]